MLIILVGRDFKISDAKIRQFYEINFVFCNIKFVNLIKIG